MVEKYFECNLVKLNEQPVDEIFYVDLMTKMITKYGENLLLYDKSHNVKFFANKQLQAYLLKVIESENVVEVTVSNKKFYFKDICLSSIIKFKIKSIKMNNKGLNTAEIEFIKDKK